MLEVNRIFGHGRHKLTTVLDDLLEFGRCKPRHQKRAGVGLVLEKYFPAGGVISREQQRRREGDRDKHGEPTAKTHKYTPNTFNSYRSAVFLEGSQYLLRLNKLRFLRADCLGCDRCNDCNLSLVGTQRNA